MSYMLLGLKCCLKVHNYIKQRRFHTETADSSSENIVMATLRLKSKKGLELPKASDPHVLLQKHIRRVLLSTELCPLGPAYSGELEYSSPLH